MLIIKVKKSYSITHQRYQKMEMNYTYILQLISKILWLFIFPHLDDYFYNSHNKYKNIVFTCVNTS